MKLVIDEGDFSDVLGRDWLEAAAGRHPLMGGAEEAKAIHQRIIEMLPRVLARKIRGLFPDGDFALAELTISVKVEGAPMGVGVSGDASVKLVPTPRP